MSLEQKENRFDATYNSSSVNIPSKSKGKKTRNPFLDTLSKSRSVYKRQITRNAQTKKSAIEHILKLTDKDANLDNLVFLGHFYNMVEYRLLDSKRFTDDCAKMGLEAFNVAQHVVFDGNKKLEEVLTFGLDKAYTTELIKMKDPIFSKQELEEARVSKEEQESIN